jgi:hypothetical protein
MPFEVEIASCCDLAIIPQPDSVSSPLRVPCGWSVATRFVLRSHNQLTLFAKPLGEE